MSPAGLEEEVVGKSERNCREGRPGRAGPRWFLLRKQWAQLHGCSLAGHTITVTQLAASPQAAGDLPHRRLPRPALHHMSPCGHPPLPQAAARRPEAVWGTETSSSEEPRLTKACVFPSRAHEVEKGIEREAHEAPHRCPQRGCPPPTSAGFRFLNPPSGSMSRASPVLDSGPSASTSCSTPRGPRKGGPGKGTGPVWESGAALSRWHEAATSPCCASRPVDSCRTSAQPPAGHRPVQVGQVAGEDQQVPGLWVGPTRVGPTQRQTLEVEAVQ